jgi:glutathione synthase
MKVCFIMCNWHEMEYEIDSTLRLIHECLMRGHEVATLTTSNLTIRDSLTMGICEVIENDGNLSEDAEVFFKQAKFKTKIIELVDFDVVFMREDPPLDPLVLNFLDSIEESVFLVNSIRGLREANNKIYTASYYDPEKEIIPATYVSKNKEYLKQIINEYDGKKMIMKPLNGFGGHGVIVIEKTAMQNINSLLDFYIHGHEKHQSNYVILQEYAEGAEEGDIRVIMLHGEPLGAIRRVPAEGEARSNISAGGTPESYTLTDKDIKLCRKIGKKLVEDGIYFAGLDLIGGKLIEVNVLSPGGIVEVNWGLKKTIESSVVDYLEKQVENGFVK